MTPDDSRGGSASESDIRTRGFANRVSLDAATRWIDAHAQRLPEEVIDRAQAAGRVLATRIEAARDSPPCDRAVHNGYALRASETVGAGDYNPLRFGLHHAGGSVPPGGAAPILSGCALPAGTDAILPFELAQSDGTAVEVFAALAAGSGVEPRGRQAVAGTALIEPGRELRAQEIGLLASLGVDHVRVTRQPRVTLVVAGPKSCEGGGAHDANGPMLCSLVHGEGGIVSSVVASAPTRAAMVAAMKATSADVILVVGRTGTGPDDEAPPALADAGHLAIHGLALRPGGSAGMGLVGNIPVVLLPGDPMGCLAAYTLLAARLIRRLGGRDPNPRSSSREAEVGRKIVSAVGSVDLCPIRFVGGRIEPVGSPESGGLSIAVRASGYVIVPAELEGYAPGARVAVQSFAELSPWT